MVRRMCRASTVVEMAYLMPVVLLMWILVIYGILLFHDKVILSGAAYETAVVGSEQMHEEEITKNELEEYFQKRINRKLLFFGSATAQIEIEENRITVSCKASKKGMSVNVVQGASITCPEKNIRRISMIKDGLEGALE